MSTGILRVGQQMPRNSQEWEQFLRKLNQFIREDGERLVLGAATAIAERTGTDLNTILQYFNDAGRVETQRALPLLNFANVGSVQSAIPITSTADALIATVSIDAHDVVYGGETVSYNAGEVVGVPVSTDVYIYADDPDIEGGAVTYEFTTDHVDLAGAPGRYRVGAIRTPVSSISASVTAATNANPCAITTGANHGLTTGDVVDFSGVGGMTELNTGTYTITVIDPNEFSLNGVDSTAFGVYTTGGTATRVSTPADGIGGAGADGGTYDIGIFYV